MMNVLKSYFFLCKITDTYDFSPESSAAVKVKLFFFLLFVSVFLLHREHIDSLLFLIYFMPFFAQLKGEFLKFQITMCDSLIIHSALSICVARRYSYTMLIRRKMCSTRRSIVYVCEHNEDVICFNLLLLIMKKNHMTI